MGKTEKHEVTPLVVLQEARDHLATAWTRGDLFKTSLSAPPVIVHLPSSVDSVRVIADNKELVESAWREGSLQMCSIGGIMMARVIINGVQSHEQLMNDPVYVEAVALLAEAISSFRSSYNNNQTTVVRFNDSPYTRQEDVLNAFDKAIKLATKPKADA